MTPEEFAKWLIENDLAEAKRGYGHASGENIADRLTEAGYKVVLIDA